MKKCIVAFVICTLYFACVTSVNAQMIFRQQAANTIEVETTIEPEKSAILMVVRMDGSISDNNNIFALAQAFSDNRGKVKFVFDMPEQRNDTDTYGEFDLYIKQPGHTELTGDFAYTVTTVRNSAVQTLMLSDKNKMADLFDKNKENNQYIELRSTGAVLKEYNEAGALQENILDIFCQNVNRNSLTETSFSSTFNMSYIMANINSGKIASNYLLHHDFSFEGLEYRNIDDDNLLQWINSFYTKNKGMSDCDLFENSYRTANSLYILNHARFNKVEGLLEKYKVELGLVSDAGYEKYKKLSDKSKVNDSIVESFKNNACLDTDTLKKIIADFVEKISNNTGGSNQSTGGNRSSESSSGYVVGPFFAASSYGNNTDNQDLVQNSLIDINDVEWARNAISALYNAKIISGDENNYFKPNNYITREEYVKMVVMAAGAYDENAECDFDDVEKYAWYYRYVASAFQAGLINGISESKFGSGIKITREDMMVIAYNSEKEKMNLVMTAKEFEDANQISEYAKVALDAMYRAKIISGINDTHIAPKSFATRAESAQVLYKIFLQ